MTNTHINQNRLDLLLSRMVGASFLGLTTATVTDMRKTKNPFYDKVLSIRNIRAIAAYDYEKNVERAREKTGQDPQSWGKGTSWMDAILDDQGRLTAFCEHKETKVKYIRVRVTHKGKTTYIAREQIVTDDATYEPGSVIPYEAFASFVPEKKSYSNQGLEPGKEIAAVTLKFESVRGLRANGERFVIDPTTPHHESVEEFISSLFEEMPDPQAQDIPDNSTVTAE